MSHYDWDRIVQRHLGPEPPQKAVWPNRPIVNEGSYVLKPTPLLKRDPALTFGFFCSQEDREESTKAYPIQNPVQLAFDPREVMRHDDAKEHCGVSFRRLWRDGVARTIWLGYRPWMLASQHFWAGCIDQAAYLRKRPAMLLNEYVNLQPENHGLILHDRNGFGAQIGAQLVPYLIWELSKQGRWPYWKPQPRSEITWTVNVNTDTSRPVV